MKKVFVLLLIGITSSVFGQTLTFGISHPFSEFRELENKLNSTYRENTTTYLLAADMAQPIEYLRTENNFNPQPVVRYFFKNADSTVQEIQYEWDKKNFRKRGYQVSDQDIESKEQLDQFIQKYTELKKEIITYFGESKSEGSLDPKPGLDYLEVNKRDSWNGDEVSVLMYLTFTNQHEIKGNAKFSPTHRIRVYVKAKSITPEKPADPVKPVFQADEKQVKIAEDYIGLLLNGKIEDSWKLISRDSKSTMKYETYAAALAMIPQLKEDLGDEIELFMSEQELINNEVFTIYSFKFQSDKSAPPNVILQVMFKPGSSAIVSFQPVRAKGKKD